MKQARLISFFHFFIWHTFGLPFFLNFLFYLWTLINFAFNFNSYMIVDPLVGLGVSFDLVLNKLRSNIIAEGLIVIYFLHNELQLVVLNFNRFHFSFGSELYLTECLSAHYFSNNNTQNKKLIICQSSILSQNVLPFIFYHYFLQAKGRSFLAL